MIMFQYTTDEQEVLITVNNFKGKSSTNYEGINISCGKAYFSYCIGFVIDL